MKLSDINDRIKSEISFEIISRLDDVELLDEYKKSKSVIREIDILSNILNSYVNENIRNKIIDEYIFHLIPPGTKGAIRGNLFNKFIRNEIISLNLKDVNILFETKSEYTDEIPDWIISNQDKTLIGMNQLDLWNGGHQINRAFKYLYFNIENVRLICVICNFTEVKTKKKKYEIFNIGFQNNTLCYVGGLKKIIIDYFRA